MTNQDSKLKIFNTLSRKKDDFKPLRDGEVGIYVCGPTVYDEPHIGHARSAYVFDIIYRYFEYKGYKVNFVRNVTDVDDKIINKAREEFKDTGINEAVKKVSEKYLRSYHDYMDRLGIKRPGKEPKATLYIAKMIDFIKTLIQKEIAYESGGDVYFDIRKAKSYGRLSNQGLEALEAGARVAPGENKKDPLDFALWKNALEGELSWQSPWGKGRPGWHIECSCMSSDILGDEFDIHGGGIDLIFPHHENELAQSEGAGKKFARYWIHNGLLTINKEKMAKSLGNFITIKEILDKYPADVLKILFLQTHYSHPVDFSWEAMNDKKVALDQIVKFLRIVNKERKEGKEIERPSKDTKNRLESVDFIKEINWFRDEFIKAMDDDFNTPNALAAIFEIVRFCKGVSFYDTYEKEKHLPILIYAEKTILEIANVLGLTLELKKDYIIDLKDKLLIEERFEAKKNKDFKKADKIRKDLEAKGIILEDTKDGTTWRIK